MADITCSISCKILNSTKHTISFPFVLHRYLKSLLIVSFFKTEPVVGFYIYSFFLSIPVVKRVLSFLKPAYSNWFDAI